MNIVAQTQEIDLFSPHHIYQF